MAGIGIVGAGIALQPAPPHVAKLLVAASCHQALADFYAFGFNHPDRYWEIVSSEQRTESLLGQFANGTLTEPVHWEEMTSAAQPPTLLSRPARHAPGEVRQPDNHLPLCFRFGRSPQAIGRRRT